jgi:hypothetical protein
MALENVDGSCGWWSLLARCGEWPPSPGRAFRDRHFRDWPSPVSTPAVFIDRRARLDEDTETLQLVPCIRSLRS